MAEFFLLGIKKLDDDHLHFFELLNRIETSSDKEFENLIIDFQAYSEYHFEKEERLMHLTFYPNADMHTKLHTSYIELIKKLKHEELSRCKLIDFARRWLLLHISLADKELSEHIRLFVENAEKVKRCI